ncbi:MAG: hypothetical protein WEB58_22195 [Planctomycetaceae bacterium]
MAARSLASFHIGGHCQMSDFIKLTVVVLIVCVSWLTDRDIRADDENKTDEQIISLIGQLRASNDKDRDAIISALNRFDEEAFSTAVQKELMAVFVDSKLFAETRVSAMTLLLERETSLDAFKENISRLSLDRSESKQIREYAMGGLSRIGSTNPEDADIASICIELLKRQSESVDVRFFAVSNLFYLRADPEKYFSLITRLMLSHDEEPNLRLRTVKYASGAVFYFPERCGALLSVLLRVAQDGQNSDEIRDTALNSFLMLMFHVHINEFYAKGAVENHAGSLMQLFNDKELTPHVRHTAGLALISIVHIEPELLPQLMEVLEGEERSLHAYSATLIGFIGPDASPAIRLLLDVSGDEASSQETREAVAQTLLWIAVD